jgi:hypothetical protein
MSLDTNAAIIESPHWNTIRDLRGIGEMFLGYLIQGSKGNCLRVYLGYRHQCGNKQERQKPKVCFHHGGE